MQLHDIAEVSCNQGSPAGLVSGISKLRLCLQGWQSSGGTRTSPDEGVTVT